jgi:hypothetical protein
MNLRILAASGALLTLPAGCAGADTDADTAPGVDLTSTVVSFSGDSFAPPKFATIADAPVDTGVFAGWFAATGGGLPGSEPRDPAKVPQVPDKPGKVYVVASATTGCRIAETALLYRAGDDLVVRFEGGEDRPECFRPYTATVQFEVPAELVSGVKTVQGEKPLPATGPAHATGFVRLGTLRATPAIRVAELGATAGPLYDELRRVGAGNLAAAQKVLTHKPAPGTRGFAFVLHGCDQTSAVLLLAPKYVSAELTGGHGAACYAATTYLVAFDVPARFVPATARPMVRG